MNIREKFFMESKQYFHGASGSKMKTNNDWNMEFDSIVNKIIWETFDVYEKEHFDKAKVEIRDIILKNLNLN